ncbi:hypothetical protein [Novosphingobium sp. 17-62-19]|uniref:hypothetical protein n=1 Tax=Novosphingobium sp. 17-62-19 TaxID=1970406 RepID=UPI0025F5126F|nr:hypothetical protein [Novosphingobium sp. 17-62-19]HQS97943.1 hypothetical protein [Novosphingobium sp.]
MIDKLTLFLPHMLMAIAVWRLLKRNDLDDDPSLPSRRVPFRQTRSKPPGGDDA